jgi:hypothetical protein
MATYNITVESSSRFTGSHRLGEFSNELYPNITIQFGDTINFTLKNTEDTAITIEGPFDQSDEKQFTTSFENKFNSTGDINGTVVQFSTANYQFAGEHFYYSAEGYDEQGSLIITSAPVVTTSTTTTTAAPIPDASTSYEFNKFFKIIPANESFLEPSYPGHPVYNTNYNRSSLEQTVGSINSFLQSTTFNSIDTTWRGGGTADNPYQADMLSQFGYNYGSNAGFALYQAFLKNSSQIKINTPGRIYYSFTPEQFNICSTYVTVSVGTRNSNTTSIQVIDNLFVGSNATNLLASVEGSYQVTNVNNHPYIIFSCGDKTCADSRTASVFKNLKVWFVPDNPNATPIADPDTGEVVVTTSTTSTTAAPVLDPCRCGSFSFPASGLLTVNNKTSALLHTRTAHVGEQQKFTTAANKISSSSPLLPNAISLDFSSYPVHISHSVRLALRTEEDGLIASTYLNVEDEVFSIGEKIEFKNFNNYIDLREKVLILEAESICKFDQSEPACCDKMPEGIVFADKISDLFILPEATTTPPPVECYYNILTDPSDPYTPTHSGFENTFGNMNTQYFHTLEKREDEQQWKAYKRTRIGFQGAGSSKYGVLASNEHFLLFAGNQDYTEFKIGDLVKFSNLNANGNPPTNDEVFYPAMSRISPSIINIDAVYQVKGFIDNDLLTEVNPAHHRTGSQSILLGCPEGKGTCDALTDNKAMWWFDKVSPSLNESTTYKLEGLTSGAIRIASQNDLIHAIGGKTAKEIREGGHPYGFEGDNGVDSGTASASANNTPFVVGETVRVTGFGESVYPNDDSNPNVTHPHVSKIDGVYTVTGIDIATHGKHFIITICVPPPPPPSYFDALKPPVFQFWTNYEKADGSLLDSYDTLGIDTNKTTDKELLALRVFFFEKTPLLSLPKEPGPIFGVNWSEQDIYYYMTMAPSETDNTTGDYCNWLRLCDSNSVLNIKTEHWLGGENINIPGSYAGHFLTGEHWHGTAARQFLPLQYYSFEKELFDPTKEGNERWRGYGKDEFEGRTFDCESRRLFQIVRHNNFSDPSPNAIRPFVKWYNVDRMVDLVDGEGTKAARKLYTLLGANPTIFEGGDQASFLSNVWVPKGAEPFGGGNWTRIQPQLFDNGAEVVRYTLEKKRILWRIPFRFKLSISKDGIVTHTMVNRGFTADDAVNLVPQEEYQLTTLNLYVEYYRISDIDRSPST